MEPRHWTVRLCPEHGLVEDTYDGEWCPICALVPDAHRLSEPFVVVEVRDDCDPHVHVQGSAQGWRAEVSEKFGPCFVHEGELLSTVLYMDGPEWCAWSEQAGHRLISNQVKLADVVALAPEFRAEAVGMTRAALFEERAKLAACLRDEMAELAAGDDERVAEILDDLRTWGTRSLADELAAVGE